MSRTILAAVSPQSDLSLGTLSVVPPAGLYVKGRALPTTGFHFTKAQMSGLAIPAYYDGIYSVSGEPTAVTISPVDPSTGSPSTRRPWARTSSPPAHSSIASAPRTPASSSSTKGTQPRPPRAV